MGFFETVNKGIVIKRKIVCLVGCVIFFLVGLLALNSSNKAKKDGVECEAEIVEVFEDSTSNGNVYYEGTIKYVVEGKEYSTRISLDKKYNVGDKYKITYRASNPESISAGDFKFAYIILFVFSGIMLLCFVLNFVVKPKGNRYYANNKYIESENTTESGDIFDIIEENENEDKKEFLFRPGKSDKKRSYEIQNSDKEVVAEFKLIKSGVFKPSQWDYTNKLTGHHEEYTVSAITEIGGDNTSFGPISIHNTVNRYFKLNGQKVWNYLKEKGYEINKLTSKALFADYQAIKHGKVVATFTSAELSDFNEAPKQGFLGNLKMPGTFKVNCNESELDMIMIIGYTIAELCQTDNRIGF